MSPTYAAVRNHELSVSPTRSGVGMFSECNES